ncbi:hypothetical protein SNE25_21035 [Mucilaginibacter sabulilitoris]|uniref:Uncharacterized protein n=1 Tax=Mucilaginibacter sabulilitoris TaxID=1173583 RepID=A0ABZ0TGV6_9SPHI|nr:hypothetical protein [Mucilaginibacter sabulilitoris]WPU91806.1 hypothetical protein SNE25_21035 [Mucilaginibacter sabulilitoris]
MKDQPTQNADLYRVGRKLGTVILTVNGETEIGRIYDKDLALKVCEFLNNCNRLKPTQNAGIKTAAQILDANRLRLPDHKGVIRIMPLDEEEILKAMEAYANQFKPTVNEDKDLLSKAKDLVAFKHGYADWYQIDCLELMEYEKDAIKVALLDDVASFYSMLWTNKLEKEREPTVNEIKEGDTVHFEYYTESDVVTGNGTIQWINEHECVVKDSDGRKHQMQISAIIKVHSKEVVNENLAGESAEQAEEDFWNFKYGDYGLSTSIPEFDDLDSEVVSTIFKAGWKECEGWQSTQQTIKAVAEIEKEMVELSKCLERSENGTQFYYELTVRIAQTRHLLKLIKP